MTAEPVPQVTTQVLIEQFPLGLDGYRYTEADLFNVVVAAAAHHRSIESVCQQLVDAPSANWVRQTLRDGLLAEVELDAFEAACNAVLVARRPPRLTARPVRLAIDLTLRPYSGTAGVLPDHLRRAEAKAGTTRFHAYAPAFVLHAGRRVTLALTFVYAYAALSDIVGDLVGRVQALGVALQRLFLDRQFATVAVLAWLHTQPFVSVVALPKRGERLKALLTGCASYRTTDTMRRADDGELTFPLWVAVRYAAGRRGKHGRDSLPFAVLGESGCSLPVQQIADEYRGRFGIESRYRQAEQVRARTTSRDPALRLLLVTVSLLLPNLWGWLKAQSAAHTPRGDRRHVRAWLDAWFRLDRFCDLLLEALKAR